jgi:hypothetical protein
MSDITLINDSEQSSLVTNGLAKNGELYLKKAGSTNAGSVIVYDNGSWSTFANEALPPYSNQYSIAFDGTNDYVNAGSVDSALSSTAFTCSVWFKLDTSLANFQSVLSQDTGWSGDNSNTTRGFFFLFDNRSSVSNRMTFNLYGSGVRRYKDLRYNNLDTADTNWHHFVMVSNVASDSYQAYLDGSAITPSYDQNGSNGAPSSLYQNNLDLYIGARQAGSRNFKGNLDEVALFNSLLSSSDVTAIYNSGVPTDLTSYSPVAWWRMGDDDSGTGTTVTDQGSGGNDATLTNGPAFSTTVPS